MLIDQVKIYVKAGDGGKGCTSFYRDRFVRKGKPDGGDGGDGGDIIFKADKNIHTLLDFQYRQYFRAGRGGHGSSNNKKGKRGEDLYIKVPQGTIIRDYYTGEVLRDLVKAGEEVVIATGGSGGKGNTKYDGATSGESGEEKTILLELKLIADVGIIGFPNVGKSSFISKVSQARPKIADYPFTTKEPVLGIVRIYDFDIVFADMPGLIENAHTGKGLGDRFLRHIERTKVLLHMVDISQTEGRDAVVDYEVINKEIRLYNEEVARKPQVIACNKIDLPHARENFFRMKNVIGKKVFPISVITGEGIKELLDEIWRIVSLYKKDNHEV